METQQRGFRIYTRPVSAGKDLSEEFNNLIKRSNVTNHSFLDRFGSQGMTREQLSRFSIQWYKVITAHKRSFAGLIHNTPDESLRADLVTILYDENGLGRPENMHTKLFLRVPIELGITESEIEKEPEIAEVKNFREKVDAIWTNGTPAEAYGIVYVFEKVGAEFHTKFLRGLERSKISDYALAYSKLHSIAEEDHAEIVSNGLSLYRNREEDLEKGIRTGLEVLTNLWNGLERYIFTNVSIRS